MSKITFRADDDLVEQLEACDASKSEVMREALRTHLDGAVGDDADASDATDATVDAALADRIDDLIADRLDAALDDRLGGRSAASPAAYTPGNAGDINVNVTLDAPSADKDDASVTREATADADAQTRKTPPIQTCKREKTPVADVAKTSPLTTFTARTAVKSSPTERSVIAATSFGPTGRFARVVDVGPPLPTY